MTQETRERIISQIHKKNDRSKIYTKISREMDNNHTSDNTNKVKKYFKY